ncbi:hypothetical protein JCM8547_001133 [Rhodosporidiobolus lusitaniae]
MTIVLPPELILHVLQHVDGPCTVSTLLAVATSASSLRSLLLSSTALWQPILHEQYEKHRPTCPSLVSAVQAEANDDGLALPFRILRHRALKDRRALQVVHDIQHPLHRLPLVDELRDSLGADVVAGLSRGEEKLTEEKDPENWLCSRWWSGELRTLLLRSEAVKVWQGIVRSDERGEETEEDFEKGLNAFAAFRGLDPQLLPHERYNVDLHPRLFESLSPPLYDGARRLEWIGAQVVDYMSSLGLKAAPDGAFHDLDNHYVELCWSRALADDESGGDGGSLPMTLVAIFCSLVRRLPLVKAEKILVKPIGFPGQVLAGLSYEGSGEWTYISVFSGGTVMRQEAMRSMLQAMGQAPMEEFFQPASAREMCLRVGRNIIASVRQGERHRGEPISHEDATASLFSVAFALTILSPTSANGGGGGGGLNVAEYIEWLVALSQGQYSLDVRVVEEIVERAQGVSRERRERVRELCEAIREEDRTEKEKKWVNGEIKWRIGHVYTAVIRGWDYKCEASEQWIRQMQVDRLPFGRHQPFYHVLVKDGSSRYVASENITDTRIGEEDVLSLVNNPALGRYFRKRERREDGRWAFVPSRETEEEYPDS